MNNRARKDLFAKAVIYLSTFITVGMLIFIIGFIFKEGLSLISLDFLKRDYNSTTQYVTANKSNDNFKEPSNLSENSVFIPQYGIAVREGINEELEEVIVIDYIVKDSPVSKSFNAANNIFSIKKLDQIKKINSQDYNDINFEEAVQIIKNSNEIKLKVTRPGGGILPMIITTLELIALSLVIAIPIGVLASIYLVEYAKPGKLINIIRFATESLAGIPSIVYGLFGMIFFVKQLSVGESLLSGGLTLSILLLPTIIRTTEETLKTVPISYKEGSFGLGANRLQTLWRIILPNAVPGILVAVILSIGRIVGESAALLFTAGTFAKIPLGVKDSGATLTVRAYMEVKEYANVEMASAIGIVLIIIVLVLNVSMRIISRKLSKNNN